MTLEPGICSAEWGSIQGRETQAMTVVRTPATSHRTGAAASAASRWRVRR
jgi:hypothetical protein